MATAAKQSDRTDLQNLLDDINHKLTRDDEYRAAHAELSRIEQGYWRENGFFRNVRDETDTIEPAARAATIQEQSAPSQSLNETQAEPAQAVANSTASIEPSNNDTQSSSKKSTSDISSARSVSPEIDAARQWLDSHGDRMLPYLDDDGSERQASLRELLDEVDSDLNDLNNLDAATQAAINCFLKFGDTV